MMSRRRISALGAFSAALAIVVVMTTAPSPPADAATRALGPRDRVLPIEAGGLRREYVVHVPPGYTESLPTPVVLMFHGGGGRSDWAAAETGWSAKADEEGFLAVYPEGSRADPSKPARFVRNSQTWNDGSNRIRVGAVSRKVDDVGFVSKLIDDLTSRFNVDDRRIYATGFSNGASMTFRIARELSDRIAAIAPLAGSDWLTHPVVQRPVPLLCISGTADPLNPINGGPIKIGQTTYGSKPPVRRMIDIWAKMLGCPGKPTVIRDRDGVKVIAYRSCKAHSEVLLYTVEGLGHVWPGGVTRLPESMVGKSSDKLKATDLIWEFFKRHPMP